MGHPPETDVATVSHFVKLKFFLAQFRKLIHLISSLQTLLVSFDAFRDRQTPLSARIFLSAWVYVLPSETLFAPVYTDEIAVLMSTLAMFAGNFVTSDYYAKGEDSLAKGLRMSRP